MYRCVFGLVLLILKMTADAHLTCRENTSLSMCFEAARKSFPFNSLHKLINLILFFRFFTGLVFCTRFVSESLHFASLLFSAHQFVFLLYSPSFFVVLYALVCLALKSFFCFDFEHSSYTVLMKHPHQNKLSSSLKLSTVSF